jgi:hypothetical protein
VSDPFAGTPVLLWQMGKVGSTSIWDALQQAGVRPIQLHVLDPARISRIVREHEDRGFAPPDHIVDAKRLQALIANPNQKFRIISLVRDPVARNLSALFESWDVYPPSCSEADGLAALAEWFVMNFDYSVLKWFDHEIAAGVGVDVYSQPFDHARKSLVIETDRVKMLILRKEDSQHEKERNLEDFLQVSGLHLGFSNTSESKPIAPLWKTMKSSAKISSILADIVYNSQLVRHFYTPEEITAFRIPWTPSEDGIYFEPPAPEQRAA